MNYSSSQVAALFSRTKQTISVWSREFAEYLSPTARPPDNRKRRFTRDDLAVLSLVAELQDQGFTFTDIHAALKAGQRGQPPEIEPTAVQAIIHTEAETRLTLENDRLKGLLIQAQETLREAKEELKHLETIRTERDRLSGQIESERRLYQEERQRLQEQVNKLTQEVTRLATEAGREYARGMMEALREQGHLGNNKRAEE